MSKIYIAYGSNLNVAQMKRRCPDAVLIGSGRLENYELLYRGNGRNLGVATVAHRKGGIVPIGIWSISANDERALDAYEGYPWLYKKRTLTVVLNSTDGERKVRGLVYVMCPEHDHPAYPTQGYVRTIAQGYRDCSLEMHYLIESLNKNNEEMMITG